MPDKRDRMREGGGVEFSREESLNFFWNEIYGTRALLSLSLSLSLSLLLSQSVWREGGGGDMYVFDGQATEVKILIERKFYFQRLLRSNSYSFFLPARNSIPYPDKIPKFEKYSFNLIVMKIKDFNGTDILTNEYS
jgi:hypothetical protein